MEGKSGHAWVCEPHAKRYFDGKPYEESCIGTIEATCEKCGVTLPRSMMRHLHRTPELQAFIEEK